MGRSDGAFGKAKSAVLGIGYSRITRDPLPEGRILGDEFVDAAHAAIADAGLTAADIDGITSFYENMGPDDLNPMTDGVTRVSLEYAWRSRASPEAHALVGKQELMQNTAMILMIKIQESFLKASG